MVMVTVWNTLSAYIRCVHLPQHGCKLVSVPADADMPVDRSAYMHPCVVFC